MPPEPTADRLHCGFWHRACCRLRKLGLAYRVGATRTAVAVSSGQKFASNCQGCCSADACRLLTMLSTTKSFTGIFSVVKRDSHRRFRINQRLPCLANSSW